MASPGRPSKLAIDKTARLTAAIMGGATREAAALSAGIGKTTLYRWLARGKKQKRGEYRDFRDAIAQAEANFEVTQAAIIATAAQGRRGVVSNGVLIPGVAGDWKAAAWLLERRRQKTYGRTDKLRVGGDKDAPPVAVEFVLDVGSPVTDRRIAGNATGDDGPAAP